ncbi:TIGR04282 family arsenosugar biosynthesis glycosyltransferase [Sungkyunkwania multivorans]|uniref:TIGR04282 family arsenosugar biosynthesis glycosyltransferase n=1 Tax=Sungkyunkwania multivorans TaxID=1173618 RepID=A0ABW3D1W6_9FLAO
MKSSKNLLIIFTRNPELGKVKTRLAKGIGDKNALAVYKMLLAHTKNVASKLFCDRSVWYSIKIRHNDLWDENVFKKHVQSGDDLGQRMQHAFKSAFDLGYEKAVIIGSDLYDLKPEHITNAFEALESNDVVFGPAKDGGYYLMGMKAMHKALFENKAWGAETVLKDSLSDLKDKSVSLLEVLNDIDHKEDLAPYPIFKPYIT